MLLLVDCKQYNTCVSVSSDRLSRFSGCRQVCQRREKVRDEY